MVRDTLRSVVVGDGPWFGDFQFDLATLPIKHSGLGILNPADISRFAFVASMLGTKDLQDRILEDEYDLPLEFYRSWESLNNIDGLLSNLELPQITQQSLATKFFDIKRSHIL